MQLLSLQRVKANELMSTEVQEKLSEFARELEQGQQKYLPELAPLSLGYG